MGKVQRVVGLQGYANLGQAQRNHLIDLQVLSKSVQLISQNSSCEPDNMLAFLEVIEVLIRRSALQTL